MLRIRQGYGMCLHSTRGHTHWGELGWDDRPDILSPFGEIPVPCNEYGPTVWAVETRHFPQLIGLSLLEQTAPIDGHISAELLLLKKEGLWKSCVVPRYAIWSRGISGLQASQVGVERGRDRRALLSKPVWPIRSTSLCQNVPSSYLVIPNLCSLT